MSDSVRPHRWQPTRLPHPWDSPGKNTGVGCHFLPQCMKVKSNSEVTSVVSDSVRPQGRQPTRVLCPWDSPGKNTGVGCHFLLQGIFLTQRSNQGLPHCKQILLSSEPIIIQYKWKNFEKLRQHCKSTILQYKIKKKFFLRYSKDKNVTNLDSWALYSLIEIDEARWKIRAKHYWCYWVQAHTMYKASK